MPRSAGSIATELAAIDAAILKAVEAASYSIAGRSKSNQTLDALTKRRDQLQRQLDLINGVSARFQATDITGLGS